MHKFQKKTCLESLKWQGEIVSGPLIVVSVIFEHKRQFSLQTWAPKKVFA